MAKKIGSKPKARKTEEVIPSARRTIASLRDIGYELPQAIADIVDNSVEWGATRVDVDFHFDGTDSWIRIVDNGVGMDSATLTEALRYGSMRDYEDGALGKFGFGLKTASTSQCRRVVVASRRSPERARVEVRALDISHIEETNRWEILIIDPEDRPRHLTEPLKNGTGTVVLWEDLDRVLDYKDPWGTWANKKLLEQADLTARHLGMVFHRFLSGQVRRRKVRMYVNGSEVEPWDPFCRDQPEATELPSQDCRVGSENGMGIVHVVPYVLPAQADFTDSTAWQRASGPEKWNKQQGFYIYRSNRLIQWGGWSRMRTVDEHTKLARVSIDFTSDLDSAFGINISKAIVKLPPDLKRELDPVVSQVINIAKSRYNKRGGGTAGGTSTRGRRGGQSAQGSAGDGNAGNRSASTGGQSVRSDSDQSGQQNSKSAKRGAIEVAARLAGEQQALERIVASLRRTAPEVAHELGW